MAQPPIDYGSLGELARRGWQSFLKDPEVYIRWVEETLKSVVQYLYFVKKWFSKFMPYFDELQKDATLSITLLELKQEARRVIGILGQYVALADFTSIADEKREAKIQAEISERLDEGEIVFDFNDADSEVRSCFRCLANFLERTITRIDKLESLADVVTVRIEKMKTKANECCVRSEEMATNMRWRKIGVFAAAVTVGIVTGGVGFFAMRASRVALALGAGAGALGGGATGAVYQMRDEQEAEFRKLARNFKTLHKVALDMDSVAGRVENTWKSCDIEGEVKDVIHISSIDLSDVPDALSRLFGILRTIKLDEVDALKHISESFREIQ